MKTAHAQTAVATITKLVKVYAPEVPYDGVANLLTDLRHYCDAHDVDLNEALANSYQQYLAEK